MVSSIDYASANSLSAITIVDINIHVVETTPIDDDVTTSESNQITTSAAPPTAWAFIANYTLTILMALCSIVGNSLVIAAFRSSPILWIKINKIIASLCVSQILIAFSVLLGFGYELSAVLNDGDGMSCRYPAVDAVVEALRKIPPQVSIIHLVMIGVDRFVAIIHPIAYEKKLTDRIVHCMIFSAWLIGGLLAMSNSLWAVSANQAPCDESTQVIPYWYTLGFGFVLYVVIAFFLLVVYARLLYIIWRQRLQIGVEKIRAVRRRVRQPNGTIIVVTDAEAAAQLKKRVEAKLRRKQFKAVFMTTVMVAAFVLLWLPYAVGCLILAIGIPLDISDVVDTVTSGIGTFNLSFNWIVCIAFSKPAKKAVKRLIVGKKKPAGGDDGQTTTSPGLCCFAVSPSSLLAEGKAHVKAFVKRGGPPKHSGADNEAFAGADENNAKVVDDFMKNNENEKIKDLKCGGEEDTKSAASVGKRKDCGDNLSRTSSSSSIRDDEEDDVDMEQIMNEIEILEQIENEAKQQEESDNVIVVNSINPAETAESGVVDSVGVSAAAAVEVPVEDAVDCLSA